MDQMIHKAQIVSDSRKKAVSKVLEMSKAWTKSLEILDFPIERFNRAIGETNVIKIAGAALLPHDERMEG